MKRKSSVFSTAALQLVALVLVSFLGCVTDDPEAPSEDSLKLLVKQHATRDRVATVLGKDHTWYEKGTASWEDFNSPTNGNPKKVDELSKRYPKVMFHTTMWLRTWVFLDQENRAQAYYRASQ
jgi:hypothetical protein